MTTQKGFNGWIQIFKGGNQKDSSGRIRDGDELINQALSNFNAKRYAPPVVLGHPANNGPALGWVTSLKEKMINGVKVLMAKLKQITPESEKMVKQGLFKKRSAAFYPNGELRHIGFLGASPPAVKGLTNIKFSTMPNPTNEFNIEFEENTSGKQVYEQAMSIMEEKYPKDSDSELHNGLQFNEAFSKSLEIVRRNKPELFEEYLNEF